LDDLLPNELPTTAFDACNEKLPYIFFYGRCDDKIIDNDHFDMIHDSYDKDKKLIAVSLDINPHRNKISVTDEVLFIINNYKTKSCYNLKELKDFINNKNKVNYKNNILLIKINYWRYHNLETAKHNIYESFVPNGTCGFQLEHLLPEKKELSKSTATEFNQYITLLFILLQKNNFNISLAIYIQYSITEIIFRHFKGHLLI